MAHDGLLPGIFAKIHPRTKTPWVSTIIIGKDFYFIFINKMLDYIIYLGIVCAIFAAVFPLGILGEMTSIGTLVAFFLVHLAVIIVSL
jgi:APA family basic amino acid/polyamine antiporter